MRLWYLSHRRPVKVQASLRIRAVSPEPSLFAYIKYGSIRRVRPKIRHLAPLDGCTCAFEEWVYGGLKVPWSHDMAHLKLGGERREIGIVIVGTICSFGPNIRRCYMYDSKSTNASKHRQACLAECRVTKVRDISVEPRHDKTCLREFPTRSDTNRPAQPLKLARVLTFRL